ncbi:MAG TPA: HU family DNA-binding protein [Acidimicrobiales bacterium]|nr:HU family DNA-binding protein [Acidimicrobiales bacterium]
MNRRDLVKAVAAHTGLEGRHIDDALRGFQDVVTAVVSKGEAVSISGFAKFAKVERAARMGRNPATGEPIRIKASKKVRVTPMKAFKDAVMSPGLAPRLARGVWPLEATTASKAPARKTTAKKTAAKKTAARKTTAAKRTTAAKKAPVRRTTAKKAVARKPAAKKTAARRR